MCPVPREATAGCSRSSPGPSASCIQTSSSRERTTPPLRSTGESREVRRRHLLLSPIPLSSNGCVFLLRCLGNLVSYLKLLLLVLVVSGQNPALLLGLDPPQTWTRTWTWSQENKVGLSVSHFKHSGQMSNWGALMDRTV